MTENQIVRKIEQNETVIQKLKSEIEDRRAAVKGFRVRLREMRKNGTNGTRTRTPSTEPVTQSTW